MTEISAQYQVWVMRRVSARQMLDRLTKRERQLALRVAAGFRNHEIADDLNISVKTVEKHRYAALNKLGFDRTAQLIRLVVQADVDKELPLRPEECGTRLATLKRVLRK